MRAIARTALLVTFAAASACGPGLLGYGFSGGGTPPGLKTVAILPFDNETSSSELPRELSDALREALEKRLGLRTATEEKADAIVRGKITRYELDVPVAIS